MVLKIELKLNFFKLEFSNQYLVFSLIIIKAQYFCHMNCLHRGTKLPIFKIRLSLKPVLIYPLTPIVAEAL